MAKLKTEFLAGYYERNPRPRRDYLFGHIDTLARLGGGWRAGLAGIGLHLGPTKTALARLGVSPQRTLPLFAATSFLDWFARRAPATHHAEGAQVVLFSDTMNTFAYPHVAIAAVEVLEAAGCRVMLPGVTDAGRPALSKGLVDLARARAEKVLAALTPCAEAGLPIVFLEPSDWSAVVDDYIALLPHDSRVACVAAQAVTFEQFIADRADRGELGISFKQDARLVLLHGHCHQKALLGTAPAIRALGLSGHAVREVDSICCGMAGSFGYEAEHYEISLRMGEQRLFPAVRAADSDTLVVAAGVSCRQQIAHGTGRAALHPAEVLRMAM
jgi:Fe-S oxidoreductase